MNNIQDLRNKISQITLGIKLPKEISIKLNKIYEEYKNSGIECCNSLNTISTSDRQELENIMEYIHSDREDVKSFVESVVSNEYEIKRVELIEKIFVKFDELSEKRNENLEKHPVGENVEKIVKNDSENDIFIKNIEQIIDNEVQTSRKNITRRLDNLKKQGKNQEEIMQIEKIIRKWELNMKATEKDAQKQILNIKKYLEVQEDEICNQIVDAIYQYKKGNTNREVFKSRITYDINSNENKEMAQNDNQYEEEIEENQEFSDNILE